jgi:hypothetical protein
MKPKGGNKNKGEKKGGGVAEVNGESRTNKPQQTD